MGRAIELDEAALAVAVEELAGEKQAAVDQASDVVAARAKGLSAPRIDALLRDELIRRGVEPDAETATFARQIAAAVEL